jgi:bifunctional non-homologous end joining protein LigD
MKRPLDTYADKRSFTRTPEPGPQLPIARSGPLLFVVQKHAARRLHYDFRLEVDGVLKSWAVPKGPSLDPAEKRLAVETEDHPFAYASFEGVIPAKEYGAGNVIVWDCGVYSPDEGQRYSFGDREEAQARVRAELEAGKLSIFLRGEKLKGSFALVRTATDSQWLLIKHKDRFISLGSDILARSHSVLSDFKVEEAASIDTSQRLDAERLAPSGPTEATPKKLSPMLAELGESVRSDPNWLYEPKLDGYRVLATVEGGNVRLVSRNGLDLTAPFPEVVAKLSTQAIDAIVLDGEIVALTADGKPSFNALQNRAQLKTAKEIAAAQRATPVAMVCFDLLHFAGTNLRAHTYVERRRYLAQCLLPSAHIQLIHASQDAEPLYAVAVEQGFEGIVAKRKDSIYQPGRRSQAWIKIKTTHSEEFVVGGYTRGKGAREAVGALLLGYWKGKELHYVGHVGSGLTEPVIKKLLAQFSGLETKQSPFVDKPELHRPTTWLKPQLVVEVRFDDRTPDGFLRAPVFLRTRDEVAADSVRREPQKRGAKPAKISTPTNQIGEIVQQLNTKSKQLDLKIGATTVRLTNLDREYWSADKAAGHPAVTKRDHIEYLARVSPYMLPHLRDRPLTMIRMPEGIHGERFFQKHWDHPLPEFVESTSVFSDHKDERHDYLLANNLPTLLWLGQSGTLEFHVWHSRAIVAPDAATKLTDYSSSRESLEASVLNYPDYLVFDIDPYIYSGKEVQGAEPELNKKGFSVGKKVAFWIRALLSEMSLRALVKTSGKTGLHVFVPIERTVTFDGARQICEMVGRHVMKEHPKDITMEWAVVKRTGKIFIDYNMNVRGKTLNVAYSPRGVSGAPISMPLTWEELEAAEPMDFTMGNVLPRLEKMGDRWHDALLAKQSLAKAFGSGS